MGGFNKVTTNKHHTSIHFLNYIKILEEFLGLFILLCTLYIVILCHALDLSYSELHSSQTKSQQTKKRYGQF